MIVADHADIRAHFARVIEDPEAPLQCLTALLLEDRSPEVREGAANLLCRLGDDRARVSLVQALRDPDEQVRSMSCSALGALRNAESGQILTVTLEKDPSADVRERAAYALGTLKSRNAIPALTKVLRGADSESVRCAAGVALGDIGGGDSVSALQSALADGSSHVRDTCERSLEMLGMLTLPLPEQVYAPMDRTEYEDYLGRNRVEHKVEKGGRIYFEVTHPVHGPAKGGGRVYYSEREWYWTLPR